MQHDRNGARCSHKVGALINHLGHANFVLLFESLVPSDYGHQLCKSWHSVRVANELGLRHPRAARLSVIVALVTALFIGLLISIILFIERSRYPALFSSSPEIQKLVEQLTPSLGLCIVLTCLQGPLYGTLRLSITSSTRNIRF